MASGKMKKAKTQFLYSLKYYEKLEDKQKVKEIRKYLTLLKSKLSPTKNQQI